MSIAALDGALAKHDKLDAIVDPALAAIPKEKSLWEKHKENLQNADATHEETTKILARLQQQPEELQRMLVQVQNSRQESDKHIITLEHTLTPLHQRVGNWAVQKFRTCACYTTSLLAGGLFGGVVCKIIFKSALEAWLGGIGGALAVTSSVYLLRKSPCCTNRC